MIIDFKTFEARLEDILKSDNQYINSFRKENFDESGNFIKYFTIRIEENKIRFDIEYNHNFDHNLKERIKSRTNLKNINEFNDIFKKSLNELFKDNYEYVKISSSYSLFLKEYNFSIIININYNKNKIYVKTIKSGMDSVNVKNVIKINSVL